MKKNLDQNKPIYIQVREKIEDMILRDQLKENEQTPSTTQLVNFYKINHITVLKGMNQLVDEGILYKKRGIGMFVSEGAKEKLMNKRKETFIHDYVVELVREADKLGISDEELYSYIQDIRKGERK